MLSFIAVCIEHEVVENEELLTFFDFDVHLLSCVALPHCAFTIIVVGFHIVVALLGGQVLAPSFLTVQDFTHEHDVYEQHEADDAQRDELGVLNIGHAVGDCTAEDDDVCVEE